MIEVADGCADVSVVTIGTLSACGIADKPLLKEVDESNLRKFGPGYSKREDGKWIKPPDWKVPDIAKVLNEQMQVRNSREYVEFTDQEAEQLQRPRV
jgi:predicted HAD superfamily Cof-like phosphohydrolase